MAISMGLTTHISASTHASNGAIYQMESIQSLADNPIGSIYNPSLNNGIFGSVPYLQTTEDDTNAQLIEEISSNLQQQMHHNKTNKEESPIIIPPQRIWRMDSEEPMETFERFPHGAERLKEKLTRQLLCFEHGIAATDTVALISALIFAWGFTTFFEIDDDVFGNSSVVRGLFYVFLGATVVMSGFSTTSMSAHHYAIRLRHQLTSQLLTRAAMGRYLEYMEYTGAVRQFARLSLVASFITLYLCLVVWMYARFVLDNDDFVWIFIAIALEVFLGAVFSIVAVCNVFGMNVPLLGDCMRLLKSDASERKAIKVFESVSQVALQQSRILLHDDDF